MEALSVLAWAFCGQRSLADYRLWEVAEVGHD